MIKNCRFCGKQFRVKPSHYDKKSYCSKGCMSEDYKTRMVGENNPNYRAIKIKRINQCKNCGIEFTSIRIRKFCSHKCYVNYFVSNDLYREIFKDRKSRMPKPPKLELKLIKVLKCRRCGKEFIRKISGQKYCSKKCKPKPGIGLETKKCNCVICGKQFEIYRYKNKFTCSEECRRQNQRINQLGEKSHRWQGGKTSKSTRFRNSLPYKQWRSSIFDRDDFTCQICLERAKNKLAAHHIKTFLAYKEYRLEIGNGVTLCWPCHQSIKGKEEKWENYFFDITGWHPNGKLLLEGGCRAVEVPEKWLDKLMEAI